MMATDGIGIKPWVRKLFPLRVWRNCSLHLTRLFPDR
jgi:hypothetical protein